MLMFHKLGLMIADLFIGESKHKKSSPLENGRLNAVDCY